MPYSVSTRFPLPGTDVPRDYEASGLYDDNGDATATVAATHTHGTAYPAVMTQAGGNWTAKFALPAAADGLGDFNVSISAGGTVRDTQTVESVNVKAMLPINVGPLPPPPPTVALLPAAPASSTRVVALSGTVVAPTVAASVVLAVQKVNAKTLRSVVVFATATLVVENGYVVRIEIPTKPNADPKYFYVLQTYLLDNNSQVVGTATQPI